MQPWHWSSLHPVHRCYQLTLRKPTVKILPPEIEAAAERCGGRPGHAAVGHQLLQRLPMHTKTCDTAATLRCQPHRLVHRLGILEHGNKVLMVRMSERRSGSLSLPVVLPVALDGGALAWQMPALSWRGY